MFINPLKSGDAIKIEIFQWVRLLTISTFVTNEQSMRVKLAADEQNVHSRSGWNIFNIL